MPDREDHVPSWDGNPTLLEEYCEEARWFQASLKKTDRVLAVARLRSRLAGPAKKLTKRMKAEEFETAGGLERYLRLLRESPLGRQPLPDAFNRIDGYENLERKKGETMPDYIVREDEAFSDLRRALRRLRLERKPANGPTTTPAPGTTTTPAASTMADGVDGYDAVSEGDGEESESPGRASAYTEEVQDVDEGSNGYFDNELRGYKLLKSAMLDAGERQSILAITRNSMEYEAVAAALRGAWEDEELRRRDTEQFKRVQKNVSYYVDGEEETDDWSNDTWSDNYTYYVDNYWDDYDWSEAVYEEEYVWSMTKEQQKELDEKLDGQEKHVKEAEVLALEVGRTLAQARQAVAATRQARGFYDHKGKTGGKGSAKGKKGKGPGKGPPVCFICGNTGHYVRDCPDRFSKGIKGKGKGKHKKGKSAYYSDEWHENYFLDDYVIHQLLYSANNPYHPGCVLLDTGATQSAGGDFAVRELAKRMEKKGAAISEINEKPWFRYADGAWIQALGRTDIKWDDFVLKIYRIEADTPILLGADFFSKNEAIINYSDCTMTLAKGRYKFALLVTPAGHRAWDVTAVAMRE